MTHDDEVKTADIVAFSSWDGCKRKGPADFEELARFYPLRVVMTDEVFQLMFMDDDGHERTDKFLKECKKYGRWLKRRLQNCEVAI